MGESMSCLSEKLLDDDQHFGYDETAVACNDESTHYCSVDCNASSNMCQCEDVVYSNLSLSYLFLCVFGAQALFIPMLDKQYTWADFVRFDFKFAEQVLALVLCAAMLLGTWNFAAAGDQGYPGDLELGTFLASQPERTAINNAVLGLMYTFFIVSLVSVRGGEVLAATMPRLTRHAEYVRGHLRTRRPGKLAPSHILIMVMIIALIASILSISLVLFMAGDPGSRQWDTASRLSQQNPFLRILTVGVAGIVICSHPRGTSGKRRRTIPVYVVFAIFLMTFIADALAISYWYSNGKEVEVCTAFSDLQARATWGDANLTCHEFGNMTLPVLTSSADNVNALKARGDPREHECAWLGATDTGEEGVWRWVNGDIVGVNGAFENWNEGEPNDVNGEDFMAQTGDGGWNDLSLSHECEFVCQGEIVCEITEPLPNLELQYRYGAWCARAALGCILAVASLKGFSAGCNYIARHSEAQIDAHFQDFSKVSAC